MFPALNIFNSDDEINEPVEMLDDSKAPDDFPFDIYQKNLDLYNEYEAWFEGERLDDTINSDNDEYELYPVKINPLFTASLKHAYALFGEYEDDSRPLVIPKLVGDDPQKDEEIIQVAENALNYLWWENGGRALMMDNGLISQVYGGCIFKFSYVPWQKWRQIPIYIEAVHPAQFVGIASNGDFWHLSENWFVKHITHADARFYGINDTEESDALPIMIEHYTTSEYKITINGKVAKMPASGREMQGENKLGVTPAVYIPHIRTNGLYGVSLLKNLLGITKEINLRVGDYGDAVNDDAHTDIAIKNVQGIPKIVTLDNGKKVIHLVGTPNISGKEAEPDMIAVGQSKASSAMSDLVSVLWEQFQRDSFVPAVAYGEDEGSQRSAQTLIARMWPLVSHVRQERVHWSTGLDVFNTNLLKLMASKSLGRMKDVTEDHTKFRMRQDWYPILPRDRAELVNEVVQRASVNLGSHEHLLELLGDVEVPDDEVTRIKKWLEYLASIEVKNNEQDNSQANPESSKERKGREPNRQVQSGKSKTEDN